MSATHDFGDSLEKAAKHVDAPWWETVYRAQFPTMTSFVAVRQDGWAQRAGIDRIITLECGRVVKVDEKVREKDFGDILLEYYSDNRLKTRGWVCKPLACDFIAYVVLPTSSCYFFDTLLLQRAWSIAGPKWVEAMRDGDKRFKRIEALNKGFVTESIGVPLADLHKAMNEAGSVCWVER